MPIGADEGAIPRLLAKLARIRSDLLTGVALVVMATVLGPHA